MSRDDLCWFHGKLTRDNAELLIRNEGKEDGTFLIRESNTATGDFVLTLLCKDEVCHYQIRRHGEDAFFSIDDKIKILHGLDTLVEFYKQASNGLVTKLTVHIKRDPPPNDSRSHGVNNLLHRATKENNITIVSELLKCGYRNLDAKNENGQTAVHLAALYCDETILELLLRAGVNVNCMDTSGYMPLHYACRSKPASFVRILIDAHANVQGRNIKNGYVPLHEAAKFGNLDVVKELLSAFAPLLPRTSFGEFPIDLAKEAGHNDVIAFLNNYKPPVANTFESQWYHGTLKRDEAVETVMNYAAHIATEQTDESISGMVPSSTDTALGSLSTDSSDAAKVCNTKSLADTSGCFLVRYSERKSAGSGYVLTLLWNNNIKHFIISKSSNYLYIDDGPYLPSLEHLIEHFMRFSDGLPVSLRYPVPPKPKPPLPLFSTMPKISSKKSMGSHPTSTKLSLDINVKELHTDVQSDESPTKHSHSQTLVVKKKHKENSGSMFNTLKLKSPKKYLIIDSMNSLRKSKSKPKPTIDVEKSLNSPPNTEDELIKTESLLKNLSFSTDFSKIAVSDADNLGAANQSAISFDGFYNTPKNNSAIDPSALIAASVEVENKTEAEVEYFTKSDVAIARERSTGIVEQFGTCASKFNTNPNGYIPTVDVRVFLDPLGGEFSPEVLEASAAELREFSNHPERLDSLISTVSTESEVMQFFNRQTSNTSSVGTPTIDNAPPKLNYFIPHECLELDAIIGEGEFGSVYKGSLVRTRNPETGAEVRCEVAIKTLRDELCRTNKQEFLREASVMIRLQHHCIVQLIGISKRETLMMVQEIVPLGSMLNFIIENRDKINPNYELKLWASQIACGMEYLESRHFVHRDLAARNILVASRNQVKISDFGLSRALSTDNDCYQASQGGKWPIKWYAPESFNNGLFSHASDVWSFGVTLWEMFTLGEAPYGDKRGVEAIQLIESGQRLPQPDLCPEYIYEIMKNCWNYKPKDRPTFRYLTDFFAKDPHYQNVIELIQTEHID